MQRKLFSMIFMAAILSPCLAVNCQLGYDERVFAVYYDKISCESAGHCWDDNVTSEIPSCYYDDSCNDGHFRGSLGQCIPCHCKVQCHKKTGVCVSGCVDGYAGDNCQTKQFTNQKDSALDKRDEMIIAALAIAAVIVIFSVSVVCVIKRWMCFAKIDKTECTTVESTIDNQEVHINDEMKDGEQHYKELEEVQVNSYEQLQIKV
ncbi:uncharacterized protein LOC144342262 [Saccoglossus kowalevskii]